MKKRKKIRKIIRGHSLSQKSQGSSSSLEHLRRASCTCVPLFLRPCPSHCFQSNTLRHRRKRTVKAPTYSCHIFKRPSLIPFKHDLARPDVLIKLNGTLVASSSIFVDEDFYFRINASYRRVEESVYFVYELITSFFWKKPITNTVYKNSRRVRQKLGKVWRTQPVITGIHVIRNTASSFTVMNFRHGTAAPRPKRESTGAPRERYLVSVPTFTLTADKVTAGP